MTNDEGSAFGFTGSWRGYAPIAISNLFLMIITLGIYRFWATTRTRRYLWANTCFIDDQLEWTGTGKELFLGFIMVLAIFGIPFLVLQFGIQALVLRGMGMLAGVTAIAAFTSIFYLTGVARFRALRYRLSRTFWHGIRGGSDNSGLRYGFTYMWRNIAGVLPVYLMVPWSMVSLWNARWNKMSFGPHNFVSDAHAGPIFKRFLLFYIAPILIFLLIFAAIATRGGFLGNMYVFTNFPPVFAAVALIVVVVGVYTLLGLIALIYYSAFLRQCIDNLRLENLDFRLEARTDDWLVLFFGDILLVLGTLGVGYIFLSYRHWSFFIRHLEAYGEIDLNALTQSSTKVSKHGEGLLDALDVGAF